MNRAANTYGAWAMIATAMAAGVLMALETGVASASIVTLDRQGFASYTDWGADNNLVVSDGLVNQGSDGALGHMVFSDENVEIAYTTPPCVSTGDWTVECQHTFHFASTEPPLLFPVRCTAYPDYPFDSHPCWSGQIFLAAGDDTAHVDSRYGRWMVDGARGEDRITSDGDLFGGAGDDVLRAGGQSGYIGTNLHGGFGRDRMIGSDRRSETFYAQEVKIKRIKPWKEPLYLRVPERDVIRCGEGDSDFVWADPKDVVRADCESVNRFSGFLYPTPICPSPPVDPGRTSRPRGSFSVNSLFRAKLRKARRVSAKNGCKVKVVARNGRPVRGWREDLAGDANKHINVDLSRKSGRVRYLWVGTSATLKARR